MTGRIGEVITDKRLHEVTQHRALTEAEDRGAADVRFARGDERSCARVHGGRVGIVEDSVFAAQPPAGVEDDPERVGAGHVARGQQRVVGRDGAGPDDHDVAERAHAVQV